MFSTQHISFIPHLSLALSILYQNLKTKCKHMRTYETNSYQNQHRYSILCANKLKPPITPEKAARVILEHLELDTETYRYGNTKVLNATKPSLRQYSIIKPLFLSCIVLSCHDSHKSVNALSFTIVKKCIILFLLELFPNGNPHWNRTKEKFMCCHVSTKFIVFFSLSQSEDMKLFHAEKNFNSQNPFISFSLHGTWNAQSRTPKWLKNSPLLICCSSLWMCYKWKAKQQRIRNEFAVILVDATMFVGKKFRILFVITRSDFHSNAPSLT